MDSRKEARYWGFVGAMIAGFAGNWLITPARHPDASGWLYAWYWIQFGGGIGLLLYSIRANRRLKVRDDDVPAGQRSEH